MESSWMLVSAAAAGDRAARDQFVAKYLPVARLYLRTRWRGKPMLTEVEDAVQDVFVDCLEQDGALARAEYRGGDFRGFLYGVTRHIAQRHERECAQHIEATCGAGSAIGMFAADDASLSHVFDREWALGVVRDALEVQVRHAAAKGEDARRRVELLRLRFRDDLSIREIARRWEVEDAWLHHQYGQARKEFERAWRELMNLAHASDELMATRWREFLGVFAPRAAPVDRAAGAGSGDTSCE